MLNRLFQHFSPLSSLCSISPNTVLSKHVLRLHPSILKTNKQTRNPGLQPFHLHVHWSYLGAKHRNNCVSHTVIEPFLKITSGMEEKILAYVLVFEHSREHGLFLAETCHGLVRQECTGMYLLAEDFTWLPKQHRWELACLTCSLAAQNINWHPGADPIICLGGCPATDTKKTGSRNPIGNNYKTACLKVKFLPASRQQKVGVHAQKTLIFKIYSF